MFGLIFFKQGLPTTSIRRVKTRDAPLRANYLESQHDTIFNNNNNLFMKIIKVDCSGVDVIT